MQKIFSYISSHRIFSLSLYFALFIIFVTGFVQIADEVLEGEHLWLDEKILQTINGFSTPFFDSFFVIVTQLGGVLGIITISVGLLSILGLRHKYKQALIIGSTVAGAALLNLVLKLLFERARPDLWEQLLKNRCMKTE